MLENNKKIYEREIDKWKNEADALRKELVDINNVLGTTKSECFAKDEIIYNLENNIQELTLKT